MRFAFVAVLLAACTDAEDHLDSFREEAAVHCWSAACSDYDTNVPPTTTTEEGIACMNDALTGGVRAEAHWTEDSFYYYSSSTTWMFTVGDQVKVFSEVNDDGDPEADVVHEEPACDGPLRVATSPLCSAGPPGGHVGVYVIESDGCP